MPGSMQPGRALGDAHTHTQFLVDTGSEVSAIPPTLADRRRTPDPLTLMAVNDTPINTYGRRSLTLNIGLRRSLPSSRMFTRS